MFKSIASALVVCLLATACSSSGQAQSLAGAPAPEFTGINHWINSAPLTTAQLRGKVTLVEFWTYTCINCIHVVPYVKTWHERYHDKGLVVVGVHTPEYDEEKDLGNVEEAVKRFGITYPVAQDNDYATWNAWGNQYWPAVYLIGKDGKIAYRHYGEGNYATTEAKIQQLLAAP